MSQKSGAAQYGQPSGRGIFFPSANISEIRPKDQIKKDFHEGFIDSQPFLFPPPPLFSPLPIASVSSSFDSGGVFTPFSPKLYGKSLLRIIFSYSQRSYILYLLIVAATCFIAQGSAVWSLGRIWGQFGIEDPFPKIPNLQMLTYTCTLWALPLISIGLTISKLDTQESSNGNRA